MGVLFRFYLTLPRETQVGLAFSAVVFVGGALGMEVGVVLFAIPEGKASLTYVACYTLEELMEFAGCLILLRTLFRYAEVHAGRLESHRTVCWRDGGAGRG